MLRPPFLKCPDTFECIGPGVIQGHFGPMTFWLLPICKRKQSPAPPEQRFGLKGHTTLLGLLSCPKHPRCGPEIGVLIQNEFFPECPFSPLTSFSKAAVT